MSDAHSNPLGTAKTPGHGAVPGRGGLDDADAPARIETALVGRETELARLLAAFERAATGGGLQSTTLLTDAGLGKSRLLHEFQHLLDLHAQRCWLVLGRSHPGGTQQPFR